MSKKLSFLHPVRIITSCFWVGNIKHAPGTWGSLFTCLVFLTLSQYMVFFMIAVLPLLAIGIYTSDRYLLLSGRPEDPKEIVIDEFVGQLLAIIISLGLASHILSAPLALNIQLSFSGTLAEPMDITVLVVLLSFCLFRLFDILKPWPVSWFDNEIEGGMGVMLDDAVAGILAGLSSALVFWLV